MTTHEARIEVGGSYDEIYSYAYSQGWTDGLPIVPPTEERVAAMIGAVGLPSEEVVGRIGIRQGEATIEKLAANAVMAGCLPEYFPVVIAAAEAMADPALNVRSASSTTNSVALISIINGPIRNELQINCSYGCLGPGWRANATIGRAIRFIQVNIGGAIPGPVSKSTFGSPGRYTFLFGEYEERSPWEPLHVERGFRLEDSTISMATSSGTSNVSDIWSATAEDLLTTLGSAMMWPGLHTIRYQTCENILAMNPDHAAVCARSGFSKKDVKEFIFEHVRRIPVHYFAPPERDRFYADGRVYHGTVQGLPSPDSLTVIVAGGHGGYHSVFIPGMMGHKMVTKLIRR